MSTLLKRISLLVLVALSLSACKELDPMMEKVKPVLDKYQGSNSTDKGITSNDMVGAIKQALSQGVTDSVSLLGSAKGFSLSDVYHIPIPQELQKPADILRKFGQGKKVDEFESRLNLAAEESVKQAIPVFTSAIKKMSVKDALGIMKGKDDAATQYFKDKTSDTLRERFMPVIQKATGQTGLTSSYKSLVSKVSSFVPNFNEKAVDIDEYVLDNSMNALFDRIAIEEQQIRKDPAKRTTDLMKSVYGYFAK
jgi:hypothetical protein